MRFIIHEQPYEKPIASGEFRYYLNTEPTGAVESWRLTTAADDFTFLRVDLDARAAESGHTYLYHAVLNRVGNIERLKYRFWDKTNHLQVIGDVVVEATAVTSTHTINSKTNAAVLNMSNDFGVWFPSVIGLGFAVRLKGQNPIATVTLNNQIGKPDSLAPIKIDINRKFLHTDHHEETIAGQTMQVKNWQLNWKSNERLITTDENGWPLRLDREAINTDGRLTAVATRLIHTQRITKT